VVDVPAQRKKRISSIDLQFEILDIIDNPGSITLQVSYTPTRF